MADKIRLPTSGGGLVNYGDEIKSKINLSPMSIVVFIVIVVILEYLLHKFF
jgi:preprotein translocase subunit Sec61beta